MSGNEPIKKISFGKKIGDVELKKDGGIQKDAYKGNSNAELIFNFYDKDRNGILDGTELQMFYAALTKSAKDGKLSAGEADKFLESICIEDVKKAEAREALKSFIDVIGGKGDKVKTAVKDDKNNVTVTYEDGKVETYLYDNKTKKSTLRILNYKDEAGEHTVNYDESRKVSTTVDKRACNKEEANLNWLFYDSKTVTETKDANGKVTEKVFYGQDNELRGKVKYLADDKIQIFDENDNLSEEQFVDESGKHKLSYINGKKATDIIDNGNTNTVVHFGGYDGEHDLKIITENGKRTTQYSETRTMTTEGDNAVLKDGDDEITLKIDDQGHIIAYAKEGENFKATARRLGIDVDNEAEYKEFCDLNAQALKRSHGGWFKIGEEVKLPAIYAASLDINKFKVDNKAETQKWKDKVGIQETKGDTEPEQHEVVEEDLSDFAKNESGKLSAENKVYFNSLPANRKDGEESVKFNQLQFNSSGEPYIKVETENGSMKFTYKEGNPLELKEMSVKAKGARTSTGFSNAADIQALVPAWILEDVGKLANMPEVSISSDMQFDDVKSLVQKAVKKGTMGETYYQENIKANCKDYCVNGYDEYIVFRTLKGGSHSICIATNPNDKKYSFVMSSNADGTLAYAYLIDTEGRDTYLFKPDMQDESIQQLYEELVNKILKGKWPEQPEQEQE